MKVKELIEELQEFDPEMKVVGIHGGTDTYAPYFLAMYQMFETEENVSRGIIEENISDEQSDEFPVPVVVISMGW